MTEKKMSWIRGVLIAIDQLGNAIAGGNPDATISARTGYFANKHETPLRPWWKAMEKVIDFTFEPLEGRGHCLRSFEADEEEHWEGSDIMRGLLGIIIVAACIPLSVITRLYVLVFPWARKGDERPLR
ncbi:hypothetical protein [Microbulbifer marinus]|uniref:Uncharacterized protein n=1 Tax=Microbulbifer marinus TaxID=658218 RepID=A0A1H4AIJ0_9GAMM|nr:hypothetical protein [Microbulbifer marinus]SEA35568.1 hypothetical protein SAMN05216562_2800 [Microbulbifer marinus]